MTLTVVPQPPKSLKKKHQKDKFTELCAILLEDGQLTQGKIVAIELAAFTYGQWIDLETKSKKDPDCETLQRQATKAKNDLFSMLKSLNLLKPKTVSGKPAKTKPLRANAPRKSRLKIVRPPDDQAGTG